MGNFNEAINRIKVAKKQRHFTNEELSKMTNIPMGTLSKILSKETKDPQISNIVKMAMALDISLDYIVLGEDNKYALSNERRRLLDEFSLLNKAGRNKVFEYILDLTYHAKYADDPKELEGDQVAG